VALPLSWSTGRVAVEYTPLPRYLTCSCQILWFLIPHLESVGRQHALAHSGSGTCRHRQLRQNSRDPWLRRRGFRRSRPSLDLVWVIPLSPQVVSQSCCSHTDGVSVAGGNVAFTLKTYPDIIYGTISSSGIVQAFHSLPQFYYRAQKFEPQNCIASIENIVEKYSLPLTSKLSVDVLPSNNRYIARSQGRHSYGQIETVFGLEDLLDIGDSVSPSRWVLSLPSYPFPFSTQNSSQLGYGFSRFEPDTFDVSQRIPCSIPLLVGENATGTRRWS
jgi:hypothetical protein